MIRNKHASCSSARDRSPLPFVCDLLLPTARYCDPYPTDCALGRDGCRRMKGLPPDGGAPAPRGTLRAAGEQCRPSSVRPLMATGPATGAVYLAYSSAARHGAGGAVTHHLHHTLAIWDLAPPNGSAAQRQRRRGRGGERVPMLASFSWFMPRRNVERAADAP